MKTEFDAIILGAGIYGLYAAHRLRISGAKVAVVEPEERPFERASFVNQARVHNGYHYPRSYSTAIKSAHYFERFSNDFGFAINHSYKQIYAVSKRFSQASGDQYEKFCKNLQIPALRIDPSQYFNPDVIEAAFETREFSFDSIKIREWFMRELGKTPETHFYFGKRPHSVDVQGDQYVLRLTDGDYIAAPLVINATYASTNQILALFGFELLKIKYEICEVIKCTVSPNLREVGITVMDGPFFSVMPFGASGQHSLYGVTFAPHKTAHNPLPTFSCQTENIECLPEALENCNTCPARPKTAWRHIVQLTKKYLSSSIELRYGESLFAVKPVPEISEIDDSRPTIIRRYSKSPSFLSVLSGKINTVYDLDQALV